MTPGAHAREIVERYRLQGWTGQALKQRIAKHARLLAVHDRAVSEALWRSVARR